MTSTSFSIGMSADRSSSRVLKPPGGGHTNIFGESEVHTPSPRPKYDQQNSSNLNFCMNTVDPNILIEQKKQDVPRAEPPPSKPAASSAADAGPKPSAPISNGSGTNGSGTNAPAPAPVPAPASTDSAARGNSRVPPGGFSSGGFW